MTVVSYHNRVRDSPRLGPEKRDVYGTTWVAEWVVGVTGAGPSVGRDCTGPG